jgi:uncharacterized protein YbcI
MAGMEVDENVTEQLAQLASRYQEQRTGRRPSAVSVALKVDTIVITLHDALSPAEVALAQTPQGAAQVQEFHRQLFADSTTEMREEIARITGRQVREMASAAEASGGSVVHAFATGVMVQLFLLQPCAAAEIPISKLPPTTAT